MTREWETWLTFDCLYKTETVLLEQIWSEAAGGELKSFQAGQGGDNCVEQGTAGVP